MPLSASEIKKIVKDKGWTFVDLAARWEVSVTWMSRLVNEPHIRPIAYDDAFRGLPDRGAASVTRQPRHKRKRRPAPRAWSPQEMFPPGRLFQAEDSSIAEEGTRFAVQEVLVQAGQVHIRFKVVDGEAAGDELEVDMQWAQTRLADLGMEA